MLCQCDSLNKTCLDLTQGPVSPGQTATVSLFQSMFNILVFTDFTDNRFSNVTPSCNIMLQNQRPTLYCSNALHYHLQ